MSHNKRFIGELVSGLIALGGAGDLSSGEKVKMAEQMGSQEVEKSRREEVNHQSDRRGGASFFFERGPALNPTFRAEHPIESEMLEQIDALPKSERAARRVSMNHAIEVATDLVESHRYPNAKAERKYFDACYDAERWKKIVDAAKFASEKTEIPLNVILAMGFIESQYHANASREDTNVYGAFQMTLDTAKGTARYAKEIYGFEINVDSEKDLFNLEKSTQLAALRLHVLKNRYGQLGLAIEAYASSESSMIKKLSDAFPEIDFGEEDWNEMQRQHDREKKAHEEHVRLLHLVKSGDASNHDREMMVKSYKEFSEAVAAYKVAKKSWSAKRVAIPEELAQADVNIVTLFESLEEEGDVPHSVTYPLAIDGIIRKMNQHVERSKALAEK